VPVPQWEKVMCRVKISIGVAAAMTILLDAVARMAETYH